MIEVSKANFIKLLLLFWCFIIIIIFLILGLSFLDLLGITFCFFLAS